MKWKPGHTEHVRHASLGVGTLVLAQRKQKRNCRRGSDEGEQEGQLIAIRTMQSKKV